MIQLNIVSTYIQDNAIETFCPTLRHMLAGLIFLTPSFIAMPHDSMAARRVRPTEPPVCSNPYALYYIVIPTTIHSIYESNDTIALVFMLLSMPTMPGTSPLPGNAFDVNHLSTDLRPVPLNTGSTVNKLWSHNLQLLTPSWFYNIMLRTLAYWKQVNAALKAPPCQLVAYSLRKQKTQSFLAVAVVWHIGC